MDRYLIDSNIFVQAKNFHYRFEFCSQFWEWILKAHDAGIVYSIDKVRRELSNGRPEDPVKQWIERLPDSFFIPDKHDSQTMRKYAEIMQWNASNTHYSAAAKLEFARADIADPFLIASAMAHGYEIITYELPKPEQKKKVKIPDAALVFGVKTHFIYDVLESYCDKAFTFQTRIIP